MLTKAELDLVRAKVELPAGVTIEVFDDDGEISACVSTDDGAAFLDLDQDSAAEKVVSDLVEYAKGAFQD